jgi:hypothetical protein
MVANEVNEKCEISGVQLQRTGIVLDSTELDEIKLNLCEFIIILQQWDKSEAVNVAKVNPFQQSRRKSSNG